ncbi:MAG: metal-dependent transcriptional regulator [Deltaproteobacteria bacterium]|nr:metal-dependent transcriptional regulator [Deltaproteobacteria bacterium]
MELSRDQEHALETLLMDEERGGEPDESAACAHVDRPAAEVFALLVAAGLARMTGDRLVLSAEGREQGQGILRRHRLTEVLMANVLGADRRKAFDVGCRMEHEMLPEFVEAICILLGHPATCPHGRPIPPGRCCVSRRTVVESQVVPLTALRPGERARVLYIQPRTHGRLHRLTSYGLSPGVVVELHQRQPAFCIRFEGTELALARDVAEDIHVTRIDEP